MNEEGAYSGVNEQSVRRHDYSEWRSRLFATEPVRGAESHWPLQPQEFGERPFETDYCRSVFQYDRQWTANKSQW